MISSPVSQRYAKALIDIGRENKRYEDYRTDLEKISSLLKENKELKDCLESPLYDTKALKRIIKRVAHLLNVSQIIVNLLCFLVDKNRISYLPEIVKTYQRIADEISGRVKATIITAYDISPDLLTQVKSVLEKVVQREVYLDVESDPEIIGGVVAKIGDIVYDGSIKTQLAGIKERLIRG